MLTVPVGCEGWAIAGLRIFVHIVEAAQRSKRFELYFHDMAEFNKTPLVTLMICRTRSPILALRPPTELFLQHLAYSFRSFENLPYRMNDVLGHKRQCRDIDNPIDGFITQIEMHDGNAGIDVVQQHQHVAGIR